MKKFILLFVFIAASSLVKAQGGYNYYEMGISGGISYERPWADLQKQYWDKGYNINVVYNYSPYVPLALEVQFGKLSGGGVNVDKYGRYFVNNYKAIAVHGDVQLGEIIDYGDNFFLGIVKNFYLGGGFGAVLNNNNPIQRTNPLPANGSLDYVFPGQDKSTDPMFIVRFGYEIKIYDYYDQPLFGIILGLQQNITLGEGLDGYSDPSAKFKNNASDQYTQLSVGIKFNFGSVSSYDKPIRNSKY